MWGSLKVGVLLWTCALSNVKTPLYVYCFEGLESIKGYYSGLDAFTGKHNLKLVLCFVVLLWDFPTNQRFMNLYSDMLYKNWHHFSLRALSSFQSNKEVAFFLLDPNVQISWIRFAITLDNFSCLSVRHKWYGASLRDATFSDCLRNILLYFVFWID